MINFVKMHNILFDHQYGIWSQHSTNLAFTHLIDQISSCDDSKKLCAGIFLDLSKDFDTVNHKIFINKLEHYRFRGLALQWFKSYLNDCKQYVEFKSETSEFQIDQKGIPRGSILGPLLFITFINNIVQTSDLLNFILFADDTSVFLSGNDIETFHETIN